MTSYALYRRYRPQTFDEVIGQEHATKPLIAALENGRLNHAFLFSGPRGCGKTSSARILARSLNCKRGPTAHPCGECDSCVALGASGSGSLDVIEIDAASHGGVDDARELRERAFFAPVDSRYKVYIIDEAHMVSAAGFNALLKLVEEPPEFVVFVFATTEPEKVLQTIRSRTHHYPFRLVPPQMMREFLEQICAKESVLVDPHVFPLVVHAGGGSVRDTLSIMDQLIAGSSSEGVTYELAVALLGSTDVALLDAACEHLAARDAGSLLAVVDRAVESGHDPRRFSLDLLERVRDLMVLDRVGSAGAETLLDIPEDRRPVLQQYAEAFSGTAGPYIAGVLSDAVSQMRGATPSRLLLELACARMVLPSDSGDLTALLHRVEQLEQGSAPHVSPASSVPSAPAAEPESTPTPTPTPVSAPPSTSPPAEQSIAASSSVTEAWPEIMKRIWSGSKVSGALLQNATPIQREGSTVTLSVPKGLVQRVSDNAVLSLATEVVQSVLGSEWSIEVGSVEESPSRPVEKDPADAAVEVLTRHFDAQVL